MALVALLGSDRFGLIGGAIAMLIGPMIYLLLSYSGTRRSGQPWDDAE
jgi:hypothetical protein